MRHPTTGFGVSALRGRARVLVLRHLGEHCKRLGCVGFLDTLVAL